MQDFDDVDEAETPPSDRYAAAVGKLTAEYRRFWEWLSSQAGFRSGRRTIRVRVDQVALQLQLGGQVAWRGVKRLRDLGLLVWRTGLGTREGTVLAAPAWVAELLEGEAPPGAERDLLARADEHRSSPPAAEPVLPSAPTSIPTSKSTPPAEPPPLDEAEAERQLLALTPRPLPRACDTAPASAPVRMRDESSPASIPSPSAKLIPSSSPGSGEDFASRDEGTKSALERCLAREHGPPPELAKQAAAAAQIHADVDRWERALEGCGVDPWIFRWVALECCDAAIPGLLKANRLTRKQVDYWVSAALKSKSPGAYFTSCIRGELPKLAGRRWPFWAVVQKSLASVAGITWDKNWQHGRSRKKAG